MIIIICCEVPLFVEMYFDFRYACDLINIYEHNILQAGHAFSSNGCPKAKSRFTMPFPETTLGTKISRTAFYFLDPIQKYIWRINQES